MRFHAVVFDLFHTLADPEEFRPSHYHRLETVADLLGLELEPFRMYWHETRDARNRNSTPSVVERIEQYLDTLGRKVDAELLAEADFQMGKYQEMAILQPAPATLQGLADLIACEKRLGLLSNADEREARIWPHSPLASYFDETCFSCDIGCVKPELQAYATILERLHISADEAVFVGDGGSNELAGAHAAGFGLVVFMRGCVQRSGMADKEKMLRLAADADVTIDCVSELAQLLHGTTIRKLL